jgi:hypothetical protein
MYLAIAIISILFFVAWIWILTEMNQAIDITEKEDNLLLNESSEFTQASR